jgi:signal transduction histidine kinase
MSSILIGDFNGATDLAAVLDADPTLSYEIVQPHRLLPALETAPRDMLILDADSHGTLGLDISTYFHSNGYFPRPAILVLAEGGHQPDDLRQAFSADDVLLRPVHEEQLLLHIERLMRLHIRQRETEWQERFRLQGDLFKMLVHDMGNAVMMISSALTFYNQMPPSAPEAVQAVFDAFDSSSLLESMIRDSLDVITVEQREISVRRVTADLIQLIESLIRRFRPLTIDKEVRLEFDAAEDLNTAIEVDPVLIWRVLLNLLVNALKFSPPNSALTISLRAGDSPRTVRVAVKDEGPGIDPAYVAGLFDKDSIVRRYKKHEARAGYGLGLVFCRIAVEAHHGRIYVESDPPHGSTFVVELPM